jgi:magnesium transporter
MSTPANRAGRPQLIEAAGVDSGINANHAAQLLKAGSFFWLDLAGVPPERMAEFSGALGLDADAQAYLVDRDQRSAFTETDDGFRWVSYALGENRDLTQIRAVFTRSFLVTVHDEPCRGLDDARNRHQRLRASEQDDGPLVLFMVLDALVNTFESVLPLLAAQLDRLETAILVGLPMPGYLQQVLEVRQLLTPIMRALAPYRRDLVSILGDVDRLPGMQTGSQRYFESHRGHVIALYDAGKDCRDETRDAMAAFSSATSERQGQVINWLTIVAAVFLPLTFVTGYLGMNLSTITHLHGALTFTLLAIVLPSVIAVFTVVLLRFLIHRMGVRLIPARAQRTAPISSITESGVLGSQNRPPRVGDGPNLRA